MEFDAVVRARRMVRAFEQRPVDRQLVDELLDLARRAPSAGNTQPWAFVVLEGDQVARLWDVTLPPERRAEFRWQGLLDAPVVVIPLVSAESYVARYAEPDKVAAGLGEDAGAWPVPYWWVDGGMAIQNLLLGVADRGLGALFYGLFDKERAALDMLGVPGQWRAPGAVALGWPAPDEPSASTRRPRPPLGDIVHYGHW